MSEIRKNEYLLPMKTKTTAEVDKLKIISTPKRKKNGDGAIDQRISLKEKLLRKAYSFEDDDINLTSEDDFEMFMQRREQYDKIRAAVFDLEYRTRASVIYEDSEFTEDIVEIIKTVPNPIVIYSTDLEPLNQKLTEFINKPGGFLADYLLPEFDDVRRMLKEIRNKGDCEIYENSVPKEGTEQFNGYIAKIIADVKKKITNERPKLFIKKWEEEFRDGLKRKGEIEEKNEKYKETDKKFETHEPSTSTAFAQKLRNLKEEGKLGRGDELVDEDVEDLENDDLSEVSTTSEESQSVIASKSNHLAGEAINKVVDVIELGSDSEHNEQEFGPMDITLMEVKTQKGKSNTANKSSVNNNADHYMDLDNTTGPNVSIPNGASASSALVTPAKFNQLDGPIEKRIEDDDDNVICID